MAGMPVRRARRLSAAQALMEKERARKLEQQRVEQLPKREPITMYSQQVSDEIVMLIIEGHAIDDNKVGTDDIRGISSIVNVSARTIYGWQLEHPDFADRVRKAREESAHRLVDRVNTLSKWVLENPTMAQAVKVASDNLKWQASVKNRQDYGESRRIDLEINISDLGDRLRRSRERLIEGEKLTEAVPVL